MGVGKRRGGNEIACRIPYGPSCNTGTEEVYEHWLLRPLKYSYSVEVSRANICEAIVLQPLHAEVCFLVS